MRRAWAAAVASVFWIWTFNTAHASEVTDAMAAVEKLKTQALGIADTLPSLRPNAMHSYVDDLKKLSRALGDQRTAANKHFSAELRMKELPNGEQQSWYCVSGYALQVQSSVDLLSDMAEGIASGGNANDYGPGMAEETTNLRNASMGDDCKPFFK